MYKLIVKRRSIALFFNDSILYTFEVRDDAFYEELSSNDLLATTFAKGFKSLDNDDILIDTTIGLLKISSVCIFIQEDEIIPDMIIECNTDLYLQSMNISSLKVMTNNVYVQVGKRVSAIKYFTFNNMINEGILLSEDLFGDTVINHAILELTDTSNTNMFINEAKDSVPISPEIRITSSRINGKVTNRGKISGEKLTTIELLNESVIAVNSLTSINITNEGLIKVDSLSSINITNMDDIICVTMRAIIVTNNGDIRCDCISAIERMTNNENLIISKNYSQVVGTFINNGLVELHGSSYVCQLENNKNMIIHNGNHTLDIFSNHGLLAFLNEVFTIHNKQTTTDNILVVKSGTLIEGDVESEHDLRVLLDCIPVNIRCNGTINYSDIELCDIKQSLNRVCLFKDNIKMNESYVSNINHVTLMVDALDVYSDLTFNNLTITGCDMYVKSKITILGDLYVDTLMLDLSDGFISTNGKMRIKSNNLKLGHIVIGEEAENGRTYYREVLSSNYLASNSTMHLDVDNLDITCAQVISKDDMNIKSETINNIVGRITSYKSIILNATTFNHRRSGKKMMASYEAPCSSPAVLEALENITIRTTTMNNIASHVLCGGKYLNNSTNHVEEAYTCGIYVCKYDTGHFYLNWAKWNGCPCFTKSEDINEWYINWCKAKGGEFIWRNIPSFFYWNPNHTSYGCITRTGTRIVINSGSCILACSANSPYIAVKSNTLRYTSGANRTNVSTTTLINMNEYMRQNKVHSLDSNVEQNNDVLSLNRRANNIVRNPFSGIDLNPWIQRMLSETIGKVWINTKYGKASGVTLFNGLLENTLDWSTTNGNIIHSEQLATTSTAMILYNVINDEKQTLVAIPAKEVNTFSSTGDMVGETITCETKGDQEHIGNRIVARDIIKLYSEEGKIRRETRKYRVHIHYDIVNGTQDVHQDISLPQQQLIGTNIEINAMNIVCIGTATSSINIVEEAKESIVKEPLLLNSKVERSWKEKSGLFTTKRCNTMSMQDCILPTSTLSDNVTMKAENISLTGTQDIAKKITFESTTLITNATIGEYSSSYRLSTSNGITKSSQTNDASGNVSQPCSVQADEIIVNCKKAAFSGTEFIADVLRDNTEDGIAFRPNITKSTYYNQTTTSAPMMQADIGNSGWYEELIPCRLLINQIIRTANKGTIILDSVVWDKNKTKIIGKFAETTYELKKFSVEWKHINQVIPNEAIVIVSFAITLYTGGAASGLLSTIASAGFTSVCCHVAGNLLRTGDILSTISSMASKEFLQSLAVSGLTAGIAGSVPIPSCIFRKVLTMGVRATVRTVVSSIIKGKSDVDWKEELVMMVASDIATSISGLDYIEHKLAHFALGAGIGGLLKKGAITGGLSAMLSEVIAEEIVNRDEIEKKVLEKMSTYNPEEYRELYIQELEPYAKVSQLITVSLLALLGHNPETAILTASNSINNNFMTTVPTLENSLKYLKKSGKKVIKKAIKKEKKLEEHLDDIELKVKGIHALSDSPHMTTYSLSKNGSFKEMSDILLENINKYEYVTTEETIERIYKAFIYEGYTLATLNKALDILTDGVPRVKEGNSYHLEESLRIMVPLWLQKGINDTANGLINTILELTPNFIKSALYIGAQIGSITITNTKRALTDIGIAPWIIQDFYDDTLITGLGKGFDMLRKTLRGNNVVDFPLEKVRRRDHSKREGQVIEMNKRRKIEKDPGRKEKNVYNLSKEALSVQDDIVEWFEKTKRLNMHKDGHANSNKRNTDISMFPNPSSAISEIPHLFRGDIDMHVMKSRGLLNPANNN